MALVIPLLGSRAAAAETGSAAPDPRTRYRPLSDEVEAALRRHVLDVWYPRAVDTANGGFLSSFARDWTPGKSEGKFSVFQARLTWVASQVSQRRPELRERFLPHARHGARYLKDVLWDKDHGGFFWGLDDDGRVAERYTDGKHLYGVSFGIYATAAAYAATQDPDLLDLGRRAFRWVEEHGHDAAHGGYTEWLTREGKPVPGAAGPRLSTVPAAGFPIGYKSMNTHIHLLEAYTELYHVWKDDVLRARLHELFEIVRDKVAVEPGCLNLYFTQDWRPLPDHDSYGHDVETAYLLLEAAEALGHRDDAKTERMARRLVDHALVYGWDEANGGFHREGTAFGEVEDARKEWWVQVEGLNALLMMHERYGGETSAYFRAFERQWSFIRDKQIDAEHAGLFELVAADGKPESAGKGRIWKDAYHEGRAFLNVADRLRRLADAGGR